MSDRPLRLNIAPDPITGQGDARTMTPLERRVLYGEGVGPIEYVSPPTNAMPVTPSGPNAQDFGFPATTVVNVTRNRLIEILSRFVKPEDKMLVDRDLVKVIFKRYEEYLGQPLVDPNE